MPNLDRSAPEPHARLPAPDSIIAALLLFVVLHPNLQVQTANASFYKTFGVSKEETANRSLFELGNGQWDIPRLRNALC